MVLSMRKSLKGYYIHVLSSGKTTFVQISQYYALNWREYLYNCALRKRQPLTFNFEQNQKNTRYAMSLGPTYLGVSVLCIYQ